MSEKLKIGFIGGGINSAVGNTHRIASQMDNRWELVSGCFSRNTEINNQTAESWNVARIHTNWREMLQNEVGKIDALAILTPSNAHFDILQEGLKLGYPIICEKTITATHQESKAIAELATEKNSFLTVINNYTGYHMLRELQAMIKRGDLGKIITVQIEMPQQGFISYTKDGSKPQPQKWRLEDTQIPTIYLDLGVHLFHIIHFLLEEEQPEKVCAMHKTNGFFDKIVDDVSCMVRYSNNINAQLWFSKTALGHRNGLKIRIFGEKASAEWLQIEPEILHFHNNKGETQKIERATNTTLLADSDRYNRFKSGHPSGFIEAFANYYYDIADSLLLHKQNKKFDSHFLTFFSEAERGMNFLHKMVQSAQSNQWEKI